MVTLDECEEEFWKILSNMEEQVSVEYGADLHTLETGSGFPTRSYKGKLSANGLEYLDHPWNLNNLSRVDKSVLSQMNFEISGIKVRWCLLFCVFFYCLLVMESMHVRITFSFRFYECIQVIFPNAISYLDGTFKEKQNDLNFKIK